MRAQDRAEALAAAEGIQINFLRKKIRKEEHVPQLLAQRGNRPGLGCILSAMEKCDTYRFGKKKDGWGLRPDAGKGLHYYFYFLDPEWGLGFLRLPTWAPFRVQFHVNGHSWLALQLSRENIAYRLLDNALVECADWPRAQLHHPWICQQRSSPPSARQNQRAALALPQKAPPPALAHKIPRTYRYRLSLFGQTAIALAFKLKDLVIIPELAAFAHP